MQDPIYKHEYLDRVQSWLTVTEEENDDESDKHLEARDRRYSCLIGTLFLTFSNKHDYCNNRKFQNY